MRYNHDLKEYQRIKDELKRRDEKAAFFTRQFFDDWKEAVKTRAAAVKDEIDESYKVGRVTLFHSFDKIYKSDFYNRNSCGYCVFLEIANAWNV